VEIHVKISLIFILFLFSGFEYDFNIYIYFCHIEALSTAIDDVTN